MDKTLTILPDAPPMPDAKDSPFYVQKEKKGEQKSYRTITHWHDELECLTILAVSYTHLDVYKRQVLGHGAVFLM